MKNILIKFKHGEEIICEAEDLGNEYFVKNCASLMPMENQSWHLLTWMPYCNATDGIKIGKEHIIFVADLESDMLKYFQQWKEILEGKRVEIKT